LLKKGAVMTKDITIRKATIEDVSAILKLWRELMDFNKQYDKHWTRSKTGHKNIGNFIRGHIKDNAYCILVAAAGGYIIGYCLSDIRKCDPPVLKIREYGNISSLVVTKDYRRRGVGENLLRETVSWFSKKGIHRIEVYVSTFNNLAREFYAKMRFKPYLEAVFLEI
jgi:ribosomal protein S18 acetylase RimI-like enzyme